MFAVWLVWKNKNRVAFEGKNPDPNLTKDIIQRATNFFFLRIQSQDYLSEGG